MEKVQLAGRTVNRLGISLHALRATGMWGEPAGREAAVAAVRRAAELGAGVIEVAVPFGPAGDLAREAELPREVFLAARLNQRVRDPEIVRRRLGRPPDLVLAAPDLLAQMTGWTVPLGVVGDRAGEGVAAVRGPHPPPPGLIEWCEARAIPYMATERAVLTNAEHTIAIGAPRSVTEVERWLAEGAATPPAGGPG